MPADSRSPEMSVSDLILYISCPRRVYFASRGFELIAEMNASRIERMLLKELALTYPEILNKCSLNADSLYHELDASLDRAQKDLPLLFPGELKETGQEMLEEAAAATRARLQEITSNLLLALEEYGREPLLAAVTPVKTESLLSSARLNLKGVPSKLVCFEDTLVPSIIRPGNCPTQGVWASDRLRAAAFTLLLENESGKEVPFAFVEYAAFGFLRRVTVRSADRREALKISRRVEKIKAGFMPEKKEGKLCDHCSFAEHCSSGSSLLSKFF